MATTTRLHPSKPRVALLAAVVAASLVTPPANAQGGSSKPPKGQAWEIRTGQDADPQIVEHFGLYDDPELADYVRELGEKLAAVSERPDLPWTFRVLDDNTVNAFALPGGFIYITRGILVHFNSEAELVAVLGHEIGHVTGRHGLKSMRRSRWAQIGLIAGSVLSPEIAQMSDVAQQGIGLLFLKHGRDAEKEADLLGLQYMEKADYPPEAMAETFAMLERHRDASGSPSLPTWASSHPSPENRQARVEAYLYDAPRSEPNSGAWGRGRFFAHLDGVQYGDNPRHGFFRNGTFYHPDLAFALDFPTGWTLQNQRQAVIGVSDGRQAVIVLAIADEASAGAAADAFFRTGPTRGPVWIKPGTSPVAASWRFRARSGSTDLAGAAAFIEYGGSVYRILTYGKDGVWQDWEASARAAAASFAEVTDPRFLEIEPMRIEIVPLGEDTTLEAFDRRHPSVISLDRLALLNHVDGPESVLPSGTQVKRVTGFNPEHLPER